jgi:hypothetical protein
VIGVGGRVLRGEEQPCRRDVRKALFVRARDMFDADKYDEVRTQPTRFKVSRIQKLTLISTVLLHLQHQLLHEPQL